MSAEGPSLKHQKTLHQPHQSTSGAQPTVSFGQSESLSFTPTDFYYHISSSRNFPTHVHSLLNSAPEADVAIMDFYPKLLNHLYGRIQSPDKTDDGEIYPNHKTSQVFIVNECLYLHKVMRVNYTIYDMWQDQDSINSRNHANILTLSQNDPDHPFKYARVLGIFHVDVQLTGESGRPVTKEVLRVQQFRRDCSYRAGFARKRLHCLEFIPAGDSNVFGFVDPDEVIQAAHLIPAFQYGTTTDIFEGESFGRGKSELEDWRYHYVNIFVDRDMYMRYASGGIGHHRVDTLDVNPAQPAEPNPETLQPDGNGKTSVVLDEDINMDSGNGGTRPMGEVEENSSDAEGSDTNDSNEEDEEDDKDDLGTEDGEDDLGAEDGEGGFEDPEDNKGYAPL